MMKQIKIESSITSREEKSFSKYLSDISKEKMITIEEEMDLSNRIKNGDEEALERMIKANLRFVVSVAKQYQYSGLPLTDLISEGNIGLIKAAKRFDPSRGFKFISYAVWWIRQSIMEALSEKSKMVRLPSNKVGILGKVNNIYSFLEQEFERPPTEEEISNIIEIPSDKLGIIIGSSKKHVSFDAPLGGDEENSAMIETLPSKSNIYGIDEQMEKESLKKQIDVNLSVLSSRARDVIKLFYGIDRDSPMSLQEIGNILDLSPERVRQIKEKSLKKLRNNNLKRELKPYL